MNRRSCEQWRENFKHFTDNESESELQRIMQQYHLYTVKIYYLVIWLTNLHNPTNLFKLIFVSLSQYSSCVRYRCRPLMATSLPRPSAVNSSCFSFISFSLLLPWRMSMQFRLFVCIFLRTRWTAVAFTSQTSCCIWLFGLNFPNGCYLHSNRRELYYITLLLFASFGVFISFVLSFYVFFFGCSGVVCTIEGGCCTPNKCTFVWFFSLTGFFMLPITKLKS